MIDAMLTARGPLPYPHFIIIGAPKCGTSWLLAALGQHSSIIVVPDEIEYFSSYIRERPIEWYLDQFDQQVKALAASKAPDHLLGEKSAHYSVMSREAIQTVRNLLPNVRLILMMRDPVSRHWAHTKRYFSKARIAEREGGDVQSVPRDRLYDFMTRSRNLGEYSAMIHHWTTIYPAEQLLLVAQEHALSSPRATFDAVLAHLGLPTTYDPASIPLLLRQRNRGPSVEMPAEVGAFLQSMFAAERQRFRAVFDEAGVVNAANVPADLRQPMARAPEPPRPDKPFAGKTVLFTGDFENIPRSEAEALVRRLGGRTTGKIGESGEGIDLVVAGAAPGAKYAKARALGIPVMNEAEFLNHARAGV
jgi:Sulfotransferase family/BRCA1 C Terminus (BRCT) domain